MQRLIVGEREDGMRLDRYLKDKLPSAPTSLLFKMLRRKNIVLNGKKASGGDHVKRGDIVTSFFSEETFAAFSADPDRAERREIVSRVRPLPASWILYEDENFLFVNKPAGILSQGDASGTESLSEMLGAYLLAKGEGDGRHAGPAHRLDRNTSGLVLCGKNRPAMQFLSEAMRDRTAEKHYCAIIRGHLSSDGTYRAWHCPDEKSGTVLIADEKRGRSLIADKKSGQGQDADRKYSRVLNADGKSGRILNTDKKTGVDNPWQEIITGIKTVSQGILHTPDGGPLACSVLDVHLITGRKHQIRAHLAHLGHPVLGDRKYGPARGVSAFPKRQMLHAESITLPASDGPFSYLGGKTFTAPLPEDMRKILEEIKHASK